MILNVCKESQNYIEFIKGKKCTACYNSPVDPDHLLTIGMGNNRNNPTIIDFTCIPLCRMCHIERHQIGNEMFEKKHKINLWKDAHSYLLEFITL